MRWSIRSALVTIVAGGFLASCGNDGGDSKRDGSDAPEIVVPDDPADPNDEVPPVDDDVICNGGECEPPPRPDVAECTDCRPVCEPEEPRLSPKELATYWALLRYKLDHGIGPVLASPTLQSEVLLKAPKDECYYGLGSSEPMADVIARGEVCGEGVNTGTPKANGAYGWALEYRNGSAWLGTLANALCLIGEGFFGFDSPIETDWLVCEYDLNAQYGTDWRPPQMLMVTPEPYDLLNLTYALDLEGMTNLFRTIGIRSVGSTEDIVIFAGPSFTGGVTMFAFDAVTGGYLGSEAFAEYSDVRRWVYAGGALYVALGLSDTSEHGGAVLRWRGTTASPFEFEVVGYLDGMGSEIIEHAGRLFVGTWPAGYTAAGILMSPPLGVDGLDESHAGAWTKIWSVTDYDPDELTAHTTGMGAMASFDGKLFFGTMHVPFLATAYALRSPERYDRNGDGLDFDELIATYLGTHRATSFFVGEDLGGDCPQIKIVYGERYLPVYDPELKSYTIAEDCRHQNLMGGQIPLQGSSGFGNYFNAYLWSAIVEDDTLYVGTFDSSSLAALALRELAEARDIPVDEEKLEALINELGEHVPVPGADLYRIVDGSGRAFAESFGGLGNFTNYGIRNLAQGDGSVFAATSNPFNLHPDGGWELLELTDAAVPLMPAIEVVPVAGNDWWIEAAVSGGPVVGVDARVNGGMWQTLELTPWHTFGDTIHTPDGSVVELRATGINGSSVVSGRYLWPSGEPAPDDLAFDASFVAVRGNRWWVEADVHTNAPLSAVYAREVGRDWTLLCPNTEVSYGGSFYVPPLGQVELRACSVADECVDSPVWTWPEVCGP